MIGSHLLQRGAASITGQHFHLGVVEPLLLTHQPVGAGIPHVKDHPKLLRPDTCEPGACNRGAPSLRERTLNLIICLTNQAA